MRDFTKLYNADLTATACPSCGRAFLAATTSLPRACPHCLNVELETLTDTDRLPPTPTPEMIIPFTVSAETLNQSVKKFAASYWFTPPDLTATNLQTRLEKQYLPVWLVDCDVSTRWQCEVGFNYEVVSHSEVYKEDRWETTEKRKTRIRWEPRLGELTRHYDNFRAPALEEHAELVEPLGKFKVWEAIEYETVEQHDSATLFRLPNRITKDAWIDVEPKILQTVEKDCKTATSSQHIRQFHWDPTYTNQHWTSLLLPLYTTYYLDDEGNQVLLLVHGRNGVLHGRKVASMRLARRASLYLAIVAVALLFLTFFFMTGDGLLLCPTVILGLLVIWPIIYASGLNSAPD